MREEIKESEKNDPRASQEAMGAKEQQVERGRGEVLRASELKRVSLRLTERDYAIFRFLLDQKFSSLETLYFRFFDQRKSANEPLPPQLFVARQRLGILRRAGLLFTEKVYSEARSLYLLSTLGYQAFQGRFPEDAYSTPIQSVDFRNYEHDKGVNYCRVAIERGGKSWKWFSERRLRMHGFKTEECRMELPKTLVPDGLFISSKGERVAFELETSPRKKSRYARKVSEYLRVMRGEDPLIHKVLFVAGSPRIYQDLKSVISDEAPRDSRWILEGYAHFLGRLFPEGSVPVIRGAGDQS
jgi:hypothetical protein